MKSQQNAAGAGHLGTSTPQVEKHGRQGRPTLATQERSRSYYRSYGPRVPSPTSSSSPASTRLRRHSVAPNASEFEVTLTAKRSSLRPVMYPGTVQVEDGRIPASGVVEVKNEDWNDTYSESIESPASTDNSDSLVYSRCQCGRRLPDAHESMMRRRSSSSENDNVFQRLYKDSAIRERRMKERQRAELEDPDLTFRPRTNHTLREERMARAVEDHPPPKEWDRRNDPKQRLCTVCCATLLGKMEGDELDGDLDQEELLRPITLSDEEKLPEPVLSQVSQETCDSNGNKIGAETKGETVLGKDDAQLDAEEEGLLPPITMSSEEGVLVNVVSRDGSEDNENRCIEGSETDEVLGNGSGQEIDNGSAPFKNSIDEQVKDVARLALRSSISQRGGESSDSDLRSSDRERRSQILKGNLRHSPSRESLLSNWSSDLSIISEVGPLEDFGPNNMPGASQAHLGSSLFLGGWDDSGVNFDNDDSDVMSAIDATIAELQSLSADSEDIDPDSNVTRRRSGMDGSRRLSVQNQSETKSQEPSTSPEGNQVNEQKLGTGSLDEEQGGLMSANVQQGVAKQITDSRDIRTKATVEMSETGQEKEADASQVNEQKLGTGSLNEEQGGLLSADVQQGVAKQITDSRDIRTEATVEMSETGQEKEADASLERSEDAVELVEPGEEKETGAFLEQSDAEEESAEQSENRVKRSEIRQEKETGVFVEQREDAVSTRGIGQKNATGDFSGPRSGDDLSLLMDERIEMRNSQLSFGPLSESEKFRVDVDDGQVSIEEQKINVEMKSRGIDEDFNEWSSSSSYQSDDSEALLVRDRIDIFRACTVVVWFAFVSSGVDTAAIYFKIGGVMMLCYLSTVPLPCPDVGTLPTRVDVPLSRQSGMWAKKLLFSRKMALLMVYVFAWVSLCDSLHSIWTASVGRGSTTPHIQSVNENDTQTRDNTHDVEELSPNGASLEGNMMFSKHLTTTTKEAQVMDQRKEYPSFLSLLNRGREFVLPPQPTASTEDAPAMDERKEYPSLLSRLKRRKQSLLPPQPIASTKDAPVVDQRKEYPSLSSLLNRGRELLLPPQHAASLDNARAMNQRKDYPSLLSLLKRRKESSLPPQQASSTKETPAMDQRKEYPSLLSLLKRRKESLLPPQEAASTKETPATDQRKEYPSLLSLLNRGRELVLPPHQAASTKETPAMEQSKEYPSFLSLLHREKESEPPPQPTASTKDAPAMDQQNQYPSLSSLPNKRKESVQHPQPTSSTNDTPVMDQMKEYPSLSSLLKRGKELVLLTVTDSVVDDGISKKDAPAMDRRKDYPSLSSLLKRRKDSLLPPQPTASTKDAPVTDQTKEYPSLSSLLNRRKEVVLPLQPPASKRDSPVEDQRKEHDDALAKPKSSRGLKRAISRFTAPSRVVRHLFSTSLHRMFQSLAVRRVDKDSLMISALVEVWTTHTNPN